MRVRTAWPVLVLAAALGVAAAPARAQEPGPLPFGARVRLTWRDRSRPYEGELRTVLGDTLVVGDSVGAPDRLVPLGGLRAVEAYGGKHDGWALTALGVVVGGAAGAWLGYHLWDPDAEFEGEGVLSYLLFLAVQSGPTASAVLGGLLGSAILGSAGRVIDRRPRWVRVAPERLRFGAVPLRGGGAAFGISVAF